MFFDRRFDALGGLLQDRMAGHDAPTAFVADQFSRPGATTAVDAAFRNDTTIMLVDDPVKRVDNMTMAWGLEAGCHSWTMKWWSWPVVHRRP